MSDSSSGADYAQAAPTYLVQRSKANDHYKLWRMDASDPSLFTAEPVNPDARFPSANHLVSIGGYLLAYSPAMASDSGDVMEYRLMTFQQGSTDPLNAAPTQAGVWPQSKFLGFYNHYNWGEEITDLVRLLPCTGYVLCCLPSTTRYSYQLWNFDPNPPAPGASDPLCTELTEQDAFSLISDGSEPSSWLSTMVPPSEYS